MNTIEKAIEESTTRLEELLIKTEAKLVWNERDLQFLLGGILQENLQAVDREISMHYDIPLSLAKYWWGGSWARSVRPALRAALKEIRGKTPKLDLLAYNDPKNAVSPLFPLVGEVKFPATYEGSTLNDESYMRAYKKDLDKMSVLKKHGLAAECCFFCVQLKEQERRGVFERLFTKYRTRVQVHSLSIPRKFIDNH